VLLTRPTPACHNYPSTTPVAGLWWVIGACRYVPQLPLAALFLVTGPSWYATITPAALPWQCYPHSTCHNYPHCSTILRHWQRALSYARPPRGRDFPVPRDFFPARQRDLHFVFWGQKILFKISPVTDLISSHSQKWSGVSHISAVSPLMH
jgi:hypothetical protein